MSFFDDKIQDEEYVMYSALENAKEKEVRKPSELLISSAFPKLAQNRFGLYIILKLSPPYHELKQEDIREGFFKQAVRFRLSLDKAKDEESKTKKKKRLDALYAVYNVLSDENARRNYDRCGLIGEVASVDDYESFRAGNALNTSSSDPVETTMDSVVGSAKQEPKPFAGPPKLHSVRSEATDNSFFYSDDDDYVSLRDHNQSSESATQQLFNSIFLCGGLSSTDNRELTIGDALAEYKNMVNSALNDLFDETVGTLQDYEKAVNDVLTAFFLSENDVTAISEVINKATTTEMEEVGVELYLCGKYDNNMDGPLKYDSNASSDSDNEIPGLSESNVSCFPISPCNDVDDVSSIDISQTKDDGDVEDQIVWEPRTTPPRKKAVFENIAQITPLQKGSREKAPKQRKMYTLEEFRQPSTKDEAKQPLSLLQQRMKSARIESNKYEA